MRNASAEILESVVKQRPIEGLRIGKITQIDSDGKIWVDFSGNIQGPVMARFVGSVSPAMLEEAVSEGSDILMTFENHDPGFPIVVGVIHASIHEISESTRPLSLEVDPSGYVTLNGRMVDVHAKEKMIFRCGKCSISLNRDGKISIKGQSIVNQAVKANRIKGGSVEIN